MPASKKAMPKPSTPVYVPRPGDLIFVRPGPDDRAGQIVARATNGPFCHVRVRFSSDEVVEALANGVTRAFIHPPEPDPADCAATGALLDADGLQHGRAWLLDNLRDSYGWLDIALDALGMLLPPQLGSRTPFLVAPRSLDCSDLAVRFLIHSGYRWLPDDLVDCPERVSPNSLARALGVIK